jgi:peptide/nickel transport system ATP-binding protein
VNAPDSGHSLLGVRNLRVDFRIDKATILHAVKGVSFDVPANSTVALVGESGSGKSVTALAMMGLLPQENSRVLPGGEVLYRGRNLLEIAPAEMRALRGADISMIFQEPMSSLNPVFTVGFQLREVLAKHLRLNPRQARARAAELLDEVGIPAPALRLDAYPFELSGGQQQRVMIAMAIACEPRLLIADEPTTALDVTIQKQILDLLAALQQRRHMSMLFITHDLAAPARDRRFPEKAGCGGRRDAATQPRIARRRSERARSAPPAQKLLFARGTFWADRVQGGERRLVQARARQDAGPRR